MASNNRTKSEESEKFCTMEERTEYFTKLEKWLQEAYAWQTVAAMFPYYLMSGQILQPNGNNFLPQFSPSAGAPGFPSGPSATSNDSTRLRDRRDSRPGPVLTPEGIEYRIPPIWKRFVAELIDSVMLFLLKLMITFVALDIFAAMNMESYKVDLLQTSLRIVDYKMAMEVASRILVWELMHRFIVCIFEALWLQHGMHGRIGGATPGKSVMGLRVVQCRNITPANRPGDPDAVIVSPGTDLGLPLALGRSIVKNLIMTFLFPICFSLFSFRFNRTGYDLACSSIVVEDPYRQQNNRAHQR
ncbi:protein FAM8A1 [Diachasma alloeum]|uniref:protein FAM8A1 n=1 Tax=Diachasma alloeum TaxID=454923 RepID=UPI00073818CB|nr:protein FAM8A1 [Diachasma alloeum]